MVYGFRLAIKTDLDSRIVRAWSIVPRRREDSLCAGDGRRVEACAAGLPLVFTCELVGLFTEAAGPRWPEPMAT